METIPVLMGSISDGSYSLPDFQREFDWTEVEIADLIVSVLNDWPAGSLLLMKKRADLFPTKDFDGGPPSQDAEILVLDGQQRLTALYQACSGIGPAVYAVDMKQVEPGGDPEECVKAFSRAEWEAEYAPPSSQYLAGYIPIYVLDESARFFEWRDDVIQDLPAGEATEARQRLKSLYSGYLRTLEKYQFPVVILESDLPPVGIARIFERVNRLGQVLTTWDLMVARLYRTDWNLRNEWELVQAEHHQIRHLCPGDGLPMLQSLALRYSGDVRQSAVLSLRPELVHDQWSQFVTGMLEVAELLSKERMGAEASMPYKVFRTILTALAVGSDIAAEWDRIRKWLWGRTFSMYFDSAANTKAQSEYGALERALTRSEGAEPSRVSRVELSQATRRSSRALWLGWHAWVQVRHDHIGAEANEVEPWTSYSLLSDWRGSPPPHLESPYHQRVLSLIVGPSPFIAAVKRHGVIEAIDDLGGREGEEQAASILEANYLPSNVSEVDALLDAPSDLIHVRLERLVSDLEEYEVFTERAP